MIPRRLCNSHAWRSMIQLSEWVWNHHCGKLEFHFDWKFINQMTKEMSDFLQAWLRDVYPRHDCHSFRCKARNASLTPHVPDLVVIGSLHLFSGHCLSSWIVADGVWNTFPLVRWFNHRPNVTMDLGPWCDKHLTSNRPWMPDNSKKYLVTVVI